MAVTWALVAGLWVSPGWSACQEPDGNASDGRVYRRHLSVDCTPAERETRAVSAAELMQALRQGKGLDLSRVVVSGDLELSELPLVSVDRLRQVSPQVQALLSAHKVREVRVIPGPFSVRDSVVHGRIVTAIKDGYVLLDGAQTMTGTAFDGVQDWSRTVFTSTVDWSNATLAREALFVQAQFLGAARFTDTQFGPHTRFHRSVFHAPVSFDGTAFRGLAELLEVTFHREVSFAGARFEQGTGFSGSQFERAATFAGAHFQREVFFLFGQFRGAADFTGGHFVGSAEFAEAQFHGRADFSHAVFDRPPDWRRVEFRGERTPPLSDSDWALNLSIMIGAGLLALGLLWVILRH